MKNTRRILPLLIVVAIMCAAIPYVDATSIPIQPFWNNTDSVSLNLSFSNGSAVCKGTILGYSGTTNITATFKLERKPTGGTYSSYHTWAQTSANSDTLRWSGDYTVDKGYTYKLTVTGTTTCDGVSESFSSYIESSY